MICLVAYYAALVEDGKFVSKGTIIGKATGQASVLLTGERVILNGSTDERSASTTARIIGKLDDPTIKITDTRRAAPGLRCLISLRLLPVAL